MIVLEQNISEKNAFIRLISGISMVAFGTARIAKDSSCLIGKAVIIAGAMKVAEGLYQYCPLVDLMNKNHDSTEMESTEMASMMD